jgi:hypothetical protein
LTCTDVKDNPFSHVVEGVISRNFVDRLIGNTNEEDPSKFMASSTDALTQRYAMNHRVGRIAKP